MTPTHLSNHVYQQFIDLGAALDVLLAHAKKTLPPDRYFVLNGTAQKLMTTCERAGAQLGLDCQI